MRKYTYLIVVLIVAVLMTVVSRAMAQSWEDEETHDENIGGQSYHWTATTYLDILPWYTAYLVLGSSFSESDLPIDELYVRCENYVNSKLRGSGYNVGYHCCLVRWICDTEVEEVHSAVQEGFHKFKHNNVIWQTNTFVSICSDE